jgi:hypothetical protein
MHKFASRLLFVLGIFLTGCAANVKYTDMSPPVTATIGDHRVTVHLGTDLSNSATYVRPRKKVVEGTIYVSGRRSLRAEKREFVVRLRKSITSQSIVVVWVQPDGGLIPLPLQH